MNVASFSVEAAAVVQSSLICFQGAALPYMKQTEASV